MRAVRLCLAIGLVLFPLVLAHSALAASDEIVGVELKGVVDPFEASYLTGAIESAESSGAAAVLLTIDTPGGLDSSMRKIISSILNSDVPVVCYVGPEGARAASAGAFILLSCDVASMAPGTNVGAASPVGVSGAIEQRKVLEDSVAFIRSLAENNDRNADWAESAVRDAESASAEEALGLGVIDSIEDSQSDLLASIDGTTIDKNGSSVVVATEGAEVVDREMGLGSSILHSLLTPDFAFLFFYLGIGLIIVEILHPGISVPGLLGAASLVAAFASFGMLPVQLLGLILLIVSAGFFVLELKYPGVSVPGVLAVVTLVIGGLVLFDPAFPGSQVSPWMIVPVAIAMALFFAVVAPVALRARKLPVITGVERLVGTEGTVVRALNPQGQAKIASELWTAESIGGTVRKGERVRVVATEGVRLIVEPVTESAEEAPEKVGGGV